MALSGQEERAFADGGWQFGCRLTTDHVWDAFIILTLLDYHQCGGTQLQVPQTGEQKDRFTAAMTARNEEVIRQGQDVAGTAATSACVNGRGPMAHHVSTFLAVHALESDPSLDDV